MGPAAGVTRIDLAPLGENDVRSLVESLHPEPLSERAVRGIVDRAEGNAFFTEELVQAADMGPDAMPWGLVDVLLVRLDRLDEDARLVVRAASASGRRVPHALLQSVVGDRVTSLDSALRTAVERNVLLAMGNDGYAFRHALLAEAIYDDLLPGERVQLHAAYMAALQKGGVGGTAAELARHARAANDVVTAAHASVAAGDEAMTVAGPDEALRHYETALELVTDQETDPRLEDIDPVDLTARACEAAVDAGQTYRAIALARDQLGKLPRGTFPHKRLRLLRVLAAAAIVADIDSGALAATTEALQLLETHPDEKLRARMLSLHARASAEERRTAEATRFANEALELGDRLGLADVVADARTTLARLRERRGETAASIALLEESVRQAAAAGELGAELRGMFSLGTMQYETGDLAAARESYARTIQRARDAGRPWAPYGLESRVLGIQAAYVLGDWDAATAMADLREDVTARARRGHAAGERHGRARRARRAGGARSDAHLRVDRPPRGHGGALLRHRGDRPARRSGRPRGRDQHARRHRRQRRRHLGQQGVPGAHPAVRTAPRGRSPVRSTTRVPTTCPTWWSGPTTCSTSPSGSTATARRRSGTRVPRAWPGWRGSAPSTPGCTGWSAT